jgi:hypothetical protein
MAVCLDDDPQCPSCRARFVPDAEAQTAVATRRPAYAARLGLVSLAVGGGLGPLLGPLTGMTIAKPPTQPGALDLNSLLWGGLGAGIGLAVGYAVGLAVFRPKQAVQT